MMLGLFLNFQTIKAQYQTCDYLSYYNFEQYYYIPWAFDNELYLDKYSAKRSSEYCLGNIAKSIDFKRSFYLKLVDKYYNKLFKSGCNKNYGIAVVIGPYRSSSYMVSKYDDKFLVEDLTKSVVIIFRIQEKRVDLLDCRTKKCDPKNRILAHEKFSGLSNDIKLTAHIFYDAQEKVLKIFKNDYNYDSNLLIKQKIDLAEHLTQEKGVGYIGITATDNNCNYRYSLLGSYICYDGYYKITPEVTLTYGQETIHPNETIIIPPGENFNLIIEYKTENEKDMMGIGYITEDKKVLPYYPKGDSNKYIYYLETKNVIAEVVLSYHNLYDHFDFYIKIQSREASRLKYAYGKDPKEGQCYEKINNDTILLKYGSLKKTGNCGGDFDLSEFKNDPYLYFYVNSLDEYGNPCEIKDIPKMKDNLEKDSKMELKLEEAGSNTYKLGVKVDKKKTYTFHSNILDYIIVFNVKNLVPSTTFSKCHIDNPLQTTYNSGIKLDYICEFRDEDNEKINVEDSKDEKDVTFISKVYRLDSDIKSDISFDTDESCNGNICTYTYTTDYNGKYLFETKFGIDEMTEVSTDGQNTFYVSPEPTTLDGSRISPFSLLEYHWISIDELNEVYFSFKEENDYRENLFLIDLVDTKDPKNTYYSDIVQPYKYMDFEKIIGNIEESHSKFNEKLSFSIYTDSISKKEYILVRLEDGKNKMRRSSLDFTASLEFGRIANATIKYILNNIGEYTACGKDLDESSSLIKKVGDTVKAGVSTEVAQIVLKTDEEHLYNYFLKDKSQVNLTVINDKGEEDKSSKAEISNSKIDGVYDLTFYSTVKGKYTILATINGKNIKDRSIDVNVDSYDQAYKLEKIELNETSYTAGEDAKLKFKILDVYGNYLNYPLNRDNLGLSYNVTLNDAVYSSQSFKFEKDEEENVYYLKDSDRKSGNYKVVLKTKYSSSSIEFEYKKNPASAHNKYSKARLLNNDQLSIGEISSAEVELYDEFKNKIEPESEQYESELGNVNVYAINMKENKIYYKRSKGNEFVTERIGIAGYFELKVYINEKEISDYGSRQFEVIDIGFDFSLSQLKMIGDKAVMLSEKGYYTLYNGLQRPAFEFDFLTIEGLPSGNVDRDNTGIEAKFYSDETDKKKLEDFWISNNKLLWILPDDISLENKKTYTLEITKNVTTKNYFFLISDYGEDKSTGKVSILKTLVSPNVLYLKAGISDSFTIELKGDDYLRIDEELKLKDLELESNCTSVIPTKKLGNKNGQYIVEVLSNNAHDFSENCQISMKYQDEEILNRVTVVVSPTEFNHFTLEESTWRTTAGSDLKIKLYPKDKYGNQIEDSVFDKREFSEESFAYLFNAKHSSGYKVSLTTTTNSVSHYIELTLTSEKAGTVTLSSIYLPEDKAIEVVAGGASKYSIGYLDGEKGLTPAGTNRNFVIEPKDKNGNKLTDKDEIESIINHYSVKVYDENGKDIHADVKVEYNKEEGKILFVIENEKSGTKVIKAYYDNEEIINENTVIRVVNGSPEFSNTKLIYNDKEYSLDKELKLSLASLPIIDVQLYDKYNNKVNDLKNLDEMDFQLNVADEQLLNYTFYNNYIRLYIDEKKVDKYFDIKKSEVSPELVLEIKPFEKKIIKVVFDDESPQKDNEVPEYFILNTNNLVLKAGEEGLLSLIFYTAKGKPMGHFFESTLDISVSCSDDKQVVTQVYNGKYYGTYNVLISSIKASDDKITCSINVKNMENEFSLRVLPYILKYCQKVQDPLPEAVAGETYELRLECYDKFTNKGYLDDELFGGRLINPKGETVELKSNSNDDNSYSLYVDPTIEGEYTIISEYLYDNITFNALPGKISGENSYVNMRKDAKAGGELDIDIVVLDKNNNVVKLEEKDTSLFDLYYRYRENNKYSDYTKVESTGKLVENDEGKTVIRYSQPVSKDGVNEFRGIYQNAFIKCSNCEVNVTAGELDLKNTEVYKFNTFSMTYTKLEKNNDVLYNEQENLFIKIYPKDSFGNKVSPQSLDDISVAIGGTPLTKLTPSGDHLEFQENTGAFSGLKDGQYDLVIAKGDNKETYSVRVSGKDGFTNEVDYSKTKLLDSSLDFNAGKYGYFNFELRDKNNARVKGAKVDDVTSDNKDFEVKAFNKQSSTILVLVTSTKANVFPNKGETKLNILIDGENALNDLKLKIYPDDLAKAKITTKLESVTTDEDLRFSLIGTDSYDNTVLLSANEPKLKVKSSTNEFSYKSSFVDILTGAQNYLYQITTVGEYTITAGNNVNDTSLFDEEYSLTVTPGEISLEKTIVLSFNDEVKAGENSIIAISPKDKNNNYIELSTEIISLFSAYLLSSDYDVIKASQMSSTSYLNYEISLETTGNYIWNVQYNKRKIKFDKNSVSVIPSSCEPENTLIYFKDQNGEYIELNKEKENDKAYSSYTSPLSLHLVFRDKFSNVIDGEKEGIYVKEAYLSGNNMDKLYWAYRSGYLELEDKSQIKNLVTKTGKSAYDFTYTIKVGQIEESFVLKVNHFGAKDEDEGYGNGNYYLENTEVEPEVAKFRVGTYYDVSLKLKTEEGLLYYGDFSTENIKCNSLDKNDKTFKCSVRQEDKGKYILTYYTELPRKESENIHNIIYLTDPEKKQGTKEIKVLLVNIYGIPSKQFTEVIQHVEPIVESDNNKLFLEFKLKDQFKNVFDSPDIIEFLFMENNGIRVDCSFAYISNETYKATITPQYPPRDINLQMYYIEGNTTKVELLPNIETSKFKFNLDYTNTIVVSKNINRMKAGENLDLNIILYDQKKNCYVDETYNSSLLSVTVQGPLEKSAELRTYQFDRDEDPNSECKYTYKIKMNPEERYVETGSYSIVVYAVDKVFTLATYTQTVISGDIDINHFKVYYTDMEEKSYNDKNIPAGEEFHFIVQGYDEFMNKIDNVQISDLEVKVDPYNENNSTLNCYNGAIGYVACSFSAKKVGIYDFTYTYKNNTISPTFEYGPNSVTYVSGACSAVFNQTTYPSKDQIDISSPFNILIKCLDKYENEVTKGGAKFTSEISLFIETTQTSVDIDYKVKDNEDGTYQISFVPPLEGEYSIYTYLEGNIYDEKKINITGKSCDGKFICPNNNNCVEDLRKCIPDEYQCHNDSESVEKPFFCNGVCVKSMTECEVAGAKKCEYMNEAYPEDKSEDVVCPYYLPLDCKRKYPDYPKLCPDGICRTSEKLKPNQRVCPIGKILCLDLTCADSIDQCYNDWPECSPIQVRCPDQSCVDDQKNCPTTITCANESDVVCPDGTCVENEIYCAKLKNCPEETPYLCSDNSCATKAENCPHSSACGHGKSLCSDLICRESC